MTVLTRSMDPTPATVDMAARTVEAIVSTGADVQRRGFIERLDLNGFDTANMIGLPVLDSHRAGSTRDQFGVIEAAELRREGLWVRMKFRNNPEALAVLADIQDGTLRGLSMGYSVQKWEEIRG